MVADDKLMVPQEKCPMAPKLGFCSLVMYIDFYDTEILMPILLSCRDEQGLLSQYSELQQVGNKIQHFLIGL